MAPRRPALDLAQVRQLQAQGLSQRAIAQRLGVSRSTLQRALNRAPPAVDVGRGFTAADLADLHALLTWWRRRQHLLAQAGDTPARAHRWTLHIETPLIARIKADAAAEHVTVTELINRIIRHYYAGTSPGAMPARSPHAADPPPANGPGWHHLRGIPPCVASPEAALIMELPAWWAWTREPDRGVMRRREGRIVRHGSRGHASVRGRTAVDTDGTAREASGIPSGDVSAPIMP